MATVGSIDLARLLQQHRQVAEPTERGAVEAEIIALLPSLSAMDVGALPADDRQALAALAGLDAFESRARTSGVDVRAFLAAADAAVPVDALQGKVARESARIETGRRDRGQRAPATNAAQQIADRLVRPGGVDGVNPLDALVKRLHAGTLRNRLQGELTKVKSAMMSVQIEAEGFQMPRMQQALAELAGAPNSLNEREKTALHKAFARPTKPGTALASTLAHLDITKLGAFATLPLPLQHELRTEIVGTQDALRMLSALGKADALTSEQEQFVKTTLALYDPSAPKTPPACAPGHDDAPDHRARRGHDGAIGHHGGPDHDNALAALAMAAGERTLADFNLEQWRDNARGEQAFNEMTAILHSGLPIEAVLMLVMARFAGRSEDKLKRKLEEAAMAEQLERSGAAATLRFRPSSLVMQDVQVAMQNWTQIMQTLAGVMSSLQEMAMTPIQNLR